MDRLLFEKLMKRNVERLSYKEKREIVAKSVDFNSTDNSVMRGYNNLHIIKEELSELDIELSKSFRGKHDRIGLIEELADVGICELYITEIFDINSEELQKQIESISLSNESVHSCEYEDITIIRTHLSELGTTVLNSINDKYDINAMIEWLSIVIHDISYIMNMYNISFDDYQKAINIKLIRERKRCRRHI